MSFVQTNKEQHPSQITLESATIKKGNKKEPLDSSMIGNISYKEGIYYPLIAANIAISDSMNFINEYPIEGGETIELKIKHSFSDDPVEYEFVVNKIANRIYAGKVQSYVIQCCSPELLLNECVRMNVPITGTADNIVKDLVANYVKSDKKIFSEPSKFEIKMLSNNRRPFDIIANIMNKSVPIEAEYSDSGNSDSEPDNETEKIRGTAGFYFWETRRGFNFFSADALCDTPEEDNDGVVKRRFAAEELQSTSHGPYKEDIANKGDGQDTRSIIKSFKFETETDVMGSLRRGKYSSFLVFFNHSTGQYEEYTYKIRSSYNNMAHLGGQSNIDLIPVNQKELSEKPSRLMSKILDDETWFNEPEPANIDENTTGNSTRFADWSKYYTAQSIARKKLLENQKAKVLIPGNPEICAGDKVFILLQMKAADAYKKTNPYDTEASGTYLVSEVSHDYEFYRGTTGICNTTLRLIRDSYGTTEDLSKHGENK